MSLGKFKKELRTSQTDLEARLWYYLRGRRFLNFKFRRQHELQNYIMDFVCLEKNLVIELDGGQHAERIAYDEKRTQFLEKDGFRVLRFWNNQLSGKGMDDVLAVIYKVLVGD